MDTPVATLSPAPLADNVPSATDIAVPRVGAVLLAPLIVRFPLDTENAQVLADPTAVTLGTLVLFSLLVEALAARYFVDELVFGTVAVPRAFITLAVCPDVVVSNVTLPLFADESIVTVPVSA